jgi:hypothetical protein
MSKVLQLHVPQALLRYSKAPKFILLQKYFCAKNLAMQRRSQHQNGRAKRSGHLV